VGQPGQGAPGQVPPGATSSPTADPRAAGWPAGSRPTYAQQGPGYGQGWSQPSAQGGYQQPGATPGAWSTGYPSGQQGYGAAGYGQQGQGAWGAQQPGAQQPTPRSAWNQPTQGAWNNQGQWTQPPSGTPQQGQQWGGYPAGSWPAQGQQQGAQWSQPAAAWGATNAAYWAADEASSGTAPYGRSVGAVLAGIILFVLGTLSALGGAGLFLVGTSVDIEEAIRQSPNLSGADVSAVRDVWNLLTGLGPAIAVIGLLELLAGLLVLAHRTVGRVIGLLYGLAGTVLGGLGIAVLLQVGRTVTDTGAQVDLTGNIAFMAPFTLIYLFVFLALAAGGRHFRRERYE
jgi:hypothetical protein